MNWLEWVGVAFFVAAIAYTGYSTVAWLLSSSPLNALAPALFVAFVTPDVIRALRYGSNRAPTSLPETFAAGISTLVVLAILFSVGASTRDDVYTDQGRALAFWGGLFFVVPCLIMLVLMLIPKSRNRIRAVREEYKRPT